MENYIVINGKRAELTKEQLKQLGISTEITPEEQYKLHEQLNKELWEFAQANGGCFSKEEWANRNIYKHYIWSDGSTAGAFRLVVDYSASAAYAYFGATFFRSEKIAQKAIDCIIKPFLNEHSEFVW